MKAGSVQQGLLELARGLVAVRVGLWLGSDVAATIDLFKSGRASTPAVVVGTVVGTVSSAGMWYLLGLALHDLGARPLLGGRR